MKPYCWSLEVDAGREKANESSEWKSIGYIIIDNRDSRCRGTVSIDLIGPLLELYGSVLCGGGAMEVTLLC